MEMTNNLFPVKLFQYLGPLHSLHQETINTIRNNHTITTCNKTRHRLDTHKQTMTSNGTAPQVKGPLAQSSPAQINHAALKAQARADVENVMNKYEYMMSHDQFQYVHDNLFTHKHEDVRFELPFGKWVGPASLKRGVVGFHSQLCLDADGQPRPGVLFFNSNTQAIVEIADDLKTAKGL